MAYPWTVYKTWTTGEILTAADLNSSFTQGISNSIPTSIDDYSTNTAQMQSTADPYPAGVESLASTIAGELERLRYVIAQITGKTQWYVDPDVTLANIMSATTVFAGAKTFTNAVTFSSTITTPLTASRVMVTDGSSNLTASSVTSTTLGFLDVGSSLTTLLAAKAPTASPTFTGTITTPLTASRVVKTNGSSALTTGTVTLSDTNEITGTLATGNGGTGTTTSLIKVGTYTGNGSTQSINHNLGTTPDIVMIQVSGTGNNVGHWFITGMTNSHDLNGTNQVNGVTAVSSTTFSLGANSAVNQNSVGYCFIAIKAQ